MNLLCRLGLHKWSKWRLWGADIVTFTPKTYKRTCEKCKGIQFGDVEIKIKPRRTVI